MSPMPSVFPIPIPLDTEACYGSGPSPDGGSLASANQGPSGRPGRSPNERPFDLAVVMPPMSATRRKPGWS